jgi:hypothetical protein
MKYVATIAMAAGLLLAGQAAALAADALHPYSNIDHRVDAGNNTGDAMVPQLNERQIQLNGIGSVAAVTATANTAAQTPVQSY